jgi:hypothetical protein
MAGIGSAVGIGAVVSVCIGLWLFMRRRKRKNRTEGDYVPDISGRHRGEGIHVREISELDAQRTPKQLDAPVFIHEMEGSRGSFRKNSIGKAYNADVPYRGAPAELGNGEREV